MSRWLHSASVLSEANHPPLLRSAGSAKHGQQLSPFRLVVDESRRSPAYTDLRSVVGAAIVAHEVLRLERLQLEPLVSEAAGLLASTDDLLKKIALAQAYGGDAARLRAQPEGSAPAERLAASYAAAGMAWADMAATIMLFGESLIQSQEFSRVERLAECLKACGEPRLASVLRKSLQETIDAKDRALTVEREAAVTYARICVEEAEDGKSKTHLLKALNETSAVVKRWSDHFYSGRLVRDLLEAVARFASKQLGDPETGSVPRERWQHPVLAELQSIRTVATPPDYRQRSQADFDHSAPTQLWIIDRLRAVVEYKYPKRPR